MSERGDAGDDPGAQAIGGDVFGVVQRVHVGEGLVKSQFDLVVCRDALLLLRAEDKAEAAVGFAILGWLGVLLGRRAAAKADARRGASIRNMPRDGLLALDRRNRAIAHEEIAEAMIIEHRRSGNATIRMSDNSTMRIAWLRERNRSVDTPALLSSTLGPKARVERKRGPAQPIFIASVVVFWFLLILTLVLKI